VAVPLSQNQKLFASALTSATGLDPRTVEAWMVSEEPAGASAGYQGTQDWLNVGITDAGPRGAGNQVWQNPVSAAKATANWMKGSWADPGFGTASQGIQNVLKTVGQSPQAQVAALQKSGWASSGYPNMPSVLNEVAGTKLPAYTAPTPLNLKQVGPINADKFPQATNPQALNPFLAFEGVEQARERLMGGTPNNTVEQGWQNLARLWSMENPPTSVHQPLVGHGAKNSLGAQPGSDVNPLQGFTLGRTDMGVDASAKPGTPIVAPNTSRVVGIMQNWYNGQPYVELQILDGPNAGRTWYVAEQIADLPRVGQTIPKGETVATYAPTGTGIEIGWAEPKPTSSMQTLAQATGQTGSATHANAPAGESFRRYLTGLGA